MTLVHQILTRPLVRPCGNEAKKERVLHIKCEGAKETMRHSSVLTVQKYGKKNEIKNCTHEIKSNTGHKGSLSFTHHQLSFSRFFSRCL